MKLIKYFYYLSCFLITAPTLAEEKSVIVDVNMNILHQVGDVNLFDRRKFITIHADASENEWDNTYGPNFTNDLRRDFLETYNVYMGRNTGGISWYLKNLAPEDKNRKGFVDSVEMAKYGEYIRNVSYGKDKKNIHIYEDRNDQVLCTQQFPFYPNGEKTNKGWAFSQTDTEEEPFGSASGDFFGIYLKSFFGNGGHTGQPRPKYVEVINEPLWYLHKEKEKVFKFHSTVAKQIKKHNPDVEVGGYCTAFPNFEENDSVKQVKEPDFDRWDKRWRSFIDIAGDDMDFWTIHLYDFPCWNNRQQYRKGSNMEATMDMMEHYTFLKFGKQKQIMISEYGSSSHQATKHWTPYRDWLHIKSANSMLIQFMQRPDRINKLIQFLPIKAVWGSSNPPKVTYQHRILRKENGPDAYSGKWVYTDIIKLFDQWKDVKGHKVDARSNNLDVLTDCYVDNNKVYVILNSLNIDNEQIISLNLKESLGKLPISMSLSCIYLDNNKLAHNLPTPQLDKRTYKSENIPSHFVLPPEANIILTYEFAEDITLDQKKDEVKYYASTYKQKIQANKSIHFEFFNLEKSDFGEAILRLGVGRAHGKTLKPMVKVNGHSIDYENKIFRGDDQNLNNKGRFSFFGLLEIPISYELLRDGANKVEISFADDGGYVSSAGIQLFNLTRKIDRFNKTPDSDITYSPFIEDNTGINTTKTTKIDFIINREEKTVSVELEKLSDQVVVTIHDLMGHHIYTQHSTDNDICVDISSFRDGAYIFTAKTNEYCASKLIRL